MMKSTKNRLPSDKCSKLPPLDISKVETEEDYWNAAWEVQKVLIADQFVQSSQDKDFISNEVTIPVPYLTDANHYELSACVTNQVNCAHTKERSSVSTPDDSYIIQPSVFTLTDCKDDVSQFRIQKEHNYNVNSLIGVHHNSIEEGDQYELHYTFFKPKVYLLRTNLTGLKLLLPADSAECQTVFVIDKIWVCEKITGSLKVFIPEGEKLELKYLTESGWGNNPRYGIPVCFSVTKYLLDDSNVIQEATDFNIENMRTAEWHKKSARETQPLSPTITEDDPSEASTSNTDETLGYGVSDVESILGD